MSSATQQLIEAYASEFENAPEYRSPRPMHRRRHHARQKRGDISLGMNGRSTRRSTFKCMKNGEL